MDDFRSRTAPLRVRNAVRDNLVVECSKASKYPVRSEVSSKKLLTKSPSAYWRPYPYTVTGLVFYVASSKVVAAAISRLLVLDP